MVSMLLLVVVVVVVVVVFVEWARKFKKMDCWNFFLNLVKFSKNDQVKSEKNHFVCQNHIKNKIEKKATFFHMYDKTIQKQKNTNFSPLNFSPLCNEMRKQQERPLPLSPPLSLFHLLFPLASSTLTNNNNNKKNDHYFQNDL